MDDNTRDIAEQIFTRPPGEPNSIDLSLDDSTVNFMNESQNIDSHKFIRDIISMITLYGIEILFGHKNIMALTEDELFLLKKYTRSYGYDMNVHLDGTTLYVEFKKFY